MSELAMDMLNEREAARVLGVSRGTLQQWRTHKRYPLPHHKIGAAVRYRRADLEAFIQAGKVTPK